MAIDLQKSNGNGGLTRATPTARTLSQATGTIARIPGHGKQWRRGSSEAIFWLRRRTRQSILEAAVDDTTLRACTTRGTDEWKPEFSVQRLACPKMS